MSTLTRDHFKRNLHLPTIHFLGRFLSFRWSNGTCTYTFIIKNVQIVFQSHHFSELHRFTKNQKKSQFFFRWGLGFSPRFSAEHHPGVTIFTTRPLELVTGRWPLKHFVFSPLVGEMIQFDEYFSNGLVQPPTRLTVKIWDGWWRHQKFSLKLGHFNFNRIL